MEKAAKRLRILAIFTFLLSPLFSWGSVTVTDETAVFASLSRMIYYSGLIPHFRGLFLRIQSFPRQLAKDDCASRI